MIEYNDEYKFTGVTDRGINIKLEGQGQKKINAQGW